MTRRQKVFLALTVLWLCVIWGHSMMPAEDSGNESNFLAEWLMQYLPWMNDYVIRKVAHFTEYAVLAGLLVALTDETIQLFAPGRSGQISDVWLDFAGFALLQLALRLVIRKKE